MSILLYDFFFFHFWSSVQLRLNNWTLLQTRRVNISDSLSCTVNCDWSTLWISCCRWCRNPAVCKLLCQLWELGHFLQTIAYHRLVIVVVWMKCTLTLTCARLTVVGSDMPINRLKKIEFYWDHDTMKSALI